MELDPSLNHLLEALDRNYPDATIKHEWMNGHAYPQHTIYITDLEGKKFHGFSHFSIEKDGVVLAKAQIFIHEIKYDHGKETK